MRSRVKAIAYVVSLIVFASAVWGPAPLLAQAFPGGGPFGGGGSGVSFPVSDTVFKVCDDGDPTKCAMLQASGISTGTTRTYSLPDLASGTLALLGAANASDFIIAGGGIEIGLGGNSNSFNTLDWSTTSTPDTGMLYTGSTGNSYVMAERADGGTDQQNGACGAAACTNPSMTWMSATAAAPQTNYNTQAYFGNAGKAVKTLTESAATSAFRFSIAASTGTGGTVDFTVFAADASDQQTLSGTLQFSGVNKAGTETCTTPTAEGTPLNSVSSASTLTCTYAADTTPANACDIQFNCVSSLTQTTLEVYYRVNLVGPGQVTPQ